MGEVRIGGGVVSVVGVCGCKGGNELLVYRSCVQLFCVHMYCMCVCMCVCVCVCISFH